MDAPSIGAGDWSLLFVDDDAEVRAMVQDAVLDDGRFTIVGLAADARAALEIAARTHPDVVILDHHMPGRSGVDVLPAMRESAPEACIVLWSSGGADHAEVRRLGATGCLSKSMPIRDVLDYAAESCALAAPRSAARRR